MDILIAGASGYVGSRLVPRLYKQGHHLRCMSRNPAFLRSRLPGDVSVVYGDVCEQASLEKALANVDVAYYLVHSLASGKDFLEKEVAAAGHFAEAARKNNVQRIIYLGGLAHGDNLSPHLESRVMVGEVFRQSGVQTIEFQAAIIIGAGSLSFDLVRALVEKLPIMITPRWVRKATQPIAISDVLAYLEQALTLPTRDNEIFEIGGPERVSYEDLMAEYAQQRGLKRVFLPVPLLTPRLSSLWLGLVTPVYARIGAKLIAGLKNETIVHTEVPPDLFSVRPKSMAAAIQEALQTHSLTLTEARWIDAIGHEATPPPASPIEGDAFRFIDQRKVSVRSSKERLFALLEAVGGQRGWFFCNFLWNLRGLIDLFVGGVGMRRGRRDPETLFPGDAVDFWRVEKISRPYVLQLRAEMKVPGDALLQFEVSESEKDCLLSQTAVFEPHGLLGRLYWYILYPIHVFMFSGMLKSIKREAEKKPTPPESEEKEQAPS